MENTVRHQRSSLTPGPNARLSFDACAGTNVGLVRIVNEDAVLDFSEIGLWAVADGVDGADAGDHASRLIVDTLGPAGQRRQLSARGAAIAGNGEPAIAH